MNTLTTKRLRQFDNGAPCIIIASKHLCTETLKWVFQSIDPSVVKNENNASLIFVIRIKTINQSINQSVVNERDQERILLDVEHNEKPMSQDYKCIWR